MIDLDIDIILQHLQSVPWFEAGMLVCFGVSWPMSVLKLLRSKTSAGKSFFFLWLVFIGYVCGIMHKVFYDMNIVILLYIFNLTVVGIDITLSYRYRNNIPQVEAA